MNRALILMAAWLALQGAPAGPRVLHMDVGDPARKSREVPLVLDAVTVGATGEVVAPADVTRRLAGVSLLLAGESHTAIEFHRVQKRIVEDLHRAGRKVVLGLEMYPYTEQERLDRWTRGELGEDVFLELSRWYRHWGYPWGYYRDIFLFARDARIPMFAINAPREVVASVRKKGFKNLTAEEAAHVPVEIDVASAEHLALFKAFFEDQEEDEGSVHRPSSEAEWRAMFEAQVAWDATMAHNALRALERNRDPDTIRVVLVGSGHAAYALGIARQAARRFGGRIATLIPVPVSDRAGRRIETVRASYADFVWGVPAERAPLYPELGASTMDAPSGRRVIMVSKSSVAKRAGIQVGDVLVAMDGTPLPDRETLNRLLAANRWGDAAALKVQRAGGEITLTAHFRRTPPEP